MFPKVQQFTFDLRGRELSSNIGQRSYRFRTLSANVDHLSVRVINDTPASLTDCSAVIDFLIVEEVSRVKEANFIDDLPPYQVIAPRYPIAFAHRCVVP